MKTLKILYFASLADALDTREEKIEVNAEKHTVGDIKSLLSKRGDVWFEKIIEQENLLSAVNQKMANEDTLLSDGDELAFFPPVTGG